MNERELYLRAIRAVPEKWINEKTRICNWFNNVVIAANPEFPAMFYKDGRWQDYKWPCAADFGLEQ